jgi:hypothetical protein
MSSVNFLEAMETLKSMFPELDTVTVRDVLDKHGGFMEGAVEELLGISRAKRGMSGGRGGGYGGEDDGYGGGSGRDGYSDEPPRSNQMGGRGGRGCASLASFISPTRRARVTRRVRFLERARDDHRALAYQLATRAVPTAGPPSTAAASARADRGSPGFLLGTRPCRSRGPRVFAVYRRVAVARRASETRARRRAFDFPFFAGVTPKRFSSRR